MASPSPSPPPTRRTKVTYGKRKPSTDFATLTKPRSRNYDDEVVPDSEPDHISARESSAAPTTQWDWKRQLDALDNDDELDKVIARQKQQEDAEMDVEPERAATPVADARPAHPGTSLFAVLGSPAPPYRERASSPAEETSQETAASGSSPSQPFPASMPQDSPPSSPAEDELPTKISKPRERKKSRGRPRDSVPPLALREESVGSASAPASRRGSQARGGSQASVSPKEKGKEKEKPKTRKTKAPTKKELREGRIESERLRSDRQVSIASTTRPYTLADLIDRSLVRAPAPSAPQLRLPAPPPLRLAHSTRPAMSDPDPISDFSSSPTRRSPARTPSRGDSASPTGYRSAPMPIPELDSPLRPNGLLGASSSFSDKLPSLSAYAKPALATAGPSASSSLLGGMTLPDSDDDDDEMPSMADLLAKDDEKRKAQAAADRQAAARQLKEQALLAQAQRKAHGAAEDSDSDLEISGDPRARLREQADARRLDPAGAAAKRAAARHAILTGAPNSSPARAARVTDTQLARAAGPQFAKHAPGRHAAGKGETLRKEDLDALALRRFEEGAERARREKAEEWARRGGKVQGVVVPVKVDLEEMARRAREMGVKQEAGMDEGGDSEDGEEGDGEYVPGREGAAGSGGEEDGAASDEDAMDVQFDDDERVLSAPPRPSAPAEHSDDDDDTASAAADTPARPRPRPRRPARKTAVLSDSSDSEPDAPPRSRTPSGPADEDLAMPGAGEDDTGCTQALEGVAFGGLEDGFMDATQAPTGITQDFGAVGVGGAASQAPAGVPLDAGLADEFMDATQAPAGLSFGGDTLVDDFADATQPAPAGLSFGDMADEFGDATQVPAARAFGGKDADAADDLDGVALGGLADGFGDATQAPGAGSAFGGLSFGDATQTPQKAPRTPQGLAGLRAARAAPLATQAMAERLAHAEPALDVSASQKARYDRVFEAEQAALVAAARPPPKLQPDLYVDARGFLTQTRPEGPDVRPWRPSPTPRPALRTPGASVDWTPGAFPTPSQTAGLSPTQRRRLRASPTPAPPPSSSLDFPSLDTTFEDEEEEEDAPRGKLFRRGARSRSPELDLGMGLAIGKPKPEKKRAVASGAERKEARKAVKGLVGDEAEESDDEAKMGFGGARRHSDDEEDEEDDDGADLADLVDMADMDEEALARQLVLEKAAEHEKLDDAAIEKRVREVAAGIHRQKRRRGGLDVDDSDEDDDADERERKRELRAKMARKKRRVDGDTLDALAKNPQTEAFYKAYEATFDEETDGLPPPLPDADDFAPDADGEMALDLDRDGELADSDDEDAPRPRAVGMGQLQEELVRAARSGVEVAPFDAEDVSRYEDPESDDEASGTSLRIVDGAQRTVRRDVDDDDDLGFLQSRKTQQANAEQQARHKKWVLEAQQAGGSARGTASASITGGGKGRKMLPPAAPKPKPVRKAESLLTSVQRRKATVIP